MRIWMDMTAPAHVLVFRPLIERFRAQGHEVELTARAYGQNTQLLDLHGIRALAFGAHGGASPAKKVESLVTRTGAATRWAAGRAFDLAVGHGSNDLALAAAMLRIPALNTFDYEFAAAQHHVGCRLARRVMVPDTIPPERLEPYGVGPGKLVQYPGLKEEYYLADFEPDEAVMDQLAVDREKVVVTVRPPPEVALYHRLSNELFPRLLDKLGNDPDVQAVVIARTDDQRERIRGLRLPSVILAEKAVDAQSLIALSDLVVSAGGTMNREAVALGTPVYTTFGGTLGGVDEALIAEGRLRPLEDPDEVALVKRSGGAQPTRRDPGLLVDLILGTVTGRAG